MAAPKPSRDPDARLDSPGGTEERGVLPEDESGAGPAWGPEQNPEQNKERWRLAWRYGEMSDAELEALAADSGSLTEVARRALQSELDKRGVNAASTAPSEAADAAPAQSRRLVIVRRFRDMPEALLAKSVLESAGIECSLDDANIIRTDWLWSNMVGGIKLRVQEEDFEAATSLLDQGPR